MKLNLVCCTLAALSIIACSSPDQETVTENTEKNTMIEETDVLAGVNLTVAEGKRLIAKGIAALPRVQEKLKNGMVIITKGTTNTYLAEELLGMEGPHGNFINGHFVPSGTRKLNKDVPQIPEIIFKDGHPSDIPYADAVKELQDGDIIFKGANMLNYARKQAAVCIGAPDGGTTFRLLPYVGEGKAELIVPIGLEKDCSADLTAYEGELRAQNEKLNFLPKLYVMKSATLFTEIEALKQFADVEVFPFGIGGVAGREGGVSLVVSGPGKEVRKALDIIASIQGEKPF